MIVLSYDWMLLFLIFVEENLLNFYTLKTCYEISLNTIEFLKIQRIFGDFEEGYHKVGHIEMIKHRNAFQCAKFDKKWSAVFLLIKESIFLNNMEVYGAQIQYSIFISNGVCKSLLYVHHIPY